MLSLPKRNCQGKDGGIGDDIFVRYLKTYHWKERFVLFCTSVPQNYMIPCFFIFHDILFPTNPSQMLLSYAPFLGQSQLSPPSGCQHLSHCIFYIYIYYYYVSHPLEYGSLECRSWAHFSISAPNTMEPFHACFQNEWMKKWLFGRGVLVWALWGDGDHQLHFIDR